jgi:hypothetical protein
MQRRRGTGMTRVFVPLDKGMTDEEIVQALKDAAAKHNAERKASEEVEPAEETPVDGESDG